MKNGMRVALLLLALAGILLTFRLGFWQLDRAAQKLAWQASIAERGQLPALQATAPAARVSTPSRSSR